MKTSFISPIFKIKGFKQEFIAIKKPAKEGDMVLILQSSDMCPFDDTYVGRFYNVEGRCDSEDFLPGIFINMGEYSWMLYDFQYLTLVPIKNN